MRHEMKSSKQQVESIPQNGSEQDYVLGLLRKFNLPVTRDNYLNLAYPDGVPDALDETTLPPEIRKA